MRRLAVANRTNIFQMLLVDDVTERKPTIHKITYIALNQEYVPIVFIFIEHPYNEVGSLTARGV